MLHDLELRKLKRKLYGHMAVVWLLIFILLVTMGNAAGLLLGEMVDQEIVAVNTRFRADGLAYLQKELEQGKKTQNWQDVTIESKYGYSLHGTYLPCPTPSNKTVIFVHGVASNRLMGLEYAPLYFREHYNVLIYDSRASGQSGGNFISWGFYEKEDLNRWVDWVAAKQPGGIIGVHGISMGAATALLQAQLNEPVKRVSFYVADSAYSDLEKLFMRQIELNLPFHSQFWSKVVLKYASFIADMKWGFFYSQVSPVQAVKTVTTPILYLHGAKDTLVPVEMCNDLVAADQGAHEVHIFADEGHIAAIFQRKDEYQVVLHQFLQEVTVASRKSAQ